MSERKPTKKWYIVQTYSGKENSVKEDLEHRIISLGMQDYIFRVLVPEETVIEKTKDGKDKEKVRQIYPGYVFVEMILTDNKDNKEKDPWFVVRNTPGVTGFLGSSGGGAKPVPLLEEEIRPILLKMGVISKPNYNHLIGKKVELTQGSLMGQVGIVTHVDHDREILIVEIEVFGGRAVPTEISFDQFKEV